MNYELRKAVFVMLRKCQAIGEDGKMMQRFESFESKTMDRLDKKYFIAVKDMLFLQIKCHEVINRNKLLSN